ncbi:hypothetical protein IM660_14255 [Ruania alkalisoli]|uniref:Uncharacterized protein n=1 Tax=Ruania alkalisoli TaxID=2779775 RepID=A0A7M1SQT9_9MICO|nr:hypothetical protein [Ruania alkalisoli]QOR69811.1 hypothetical protein IM660_14255 [Ruania alkalisoli]
MDRRQEAQQWAPELREWARTEQFSQPLRWGEIEAAILEHDLPRLPEEKAWVTAIGIVGWVGIALLAIPSFGSAVLGLVLVAVGSAAEGAAEAEGWFTGARFFFFLAAALGVGFFVDWWRSRRRAALQLVTSALIAAGSGAALVVVLASDGPPPGLLLLGFILTAIVSGVLVFIAGLVSTPEGRPRRRRPPRRGPRSSRIRDRWRRGRDVVLQILRQRRLVDIDDDDQVRLNELPLGYWSEVEGVDRQEWKRILELRHVGWRDFDATDARWPQ